MSLVLVTPPDEILFPQVRAAIPEDFSQLMALCGQLYQENAAVRVNWKLVESVIMNGINGKNAVIGVIGDSDNIEAMIYLRISELWYSSEPILEELYNYVAPDYRGANRHNATALLKFSKKCVKTFNVPLLIGVISNYRTKAKIKVYERELGPMSGAFFMYRG